MKIIYNKLVRDRIPEIIENDNHTPVTRKLNKADFKKELLKKLEEEAAEVSLAKGKKELINELADIQEIMLAVYDTFKIECSDVTKCARKKRSERGGFKKQIFLESVVENK